MSLKLSDGTVWEGAYLLNVDGRLFLYIPGAAMRDVFDKLIEPANTGAISFTEGRDETVYEGFTRLTAVRDEENGMITAVLRKGDA